MDSPCTKQTVCKVLKIFQYGKYLVAYVFNTSEEAAIKVWKNIFLVFPAKWPDVSAPINEWSPRRLFAFFFIACYECSSEVFVAVFVYVLLWRLCLDTTVGICLLIEKNICIWRKNMHTIYLSVRITCFSGINHYQCVCLYMIMLL